MPAAGILGLGLLVALVGYLFCRAFGPPERESMPGEVAFQQLLVGLVVCGWPALLLAELGRFSLLGWGGLLLLCTAVLLVARWKAVRSWRGPALRLRGGGFLNLAVFLLLGFFLCFPGEWILGGQDPGVYLATGASIARSGGLLRYDPEIARMPAAARSLLLSHYIGQWWQLPGFYVTDFASGQVTPQFLHLYPTWLALGYAAGGISGVLLLTPLFSLLGLVAGFFLVRRLFGEWPARLALVLLALNPAQVWFARQPVAESLTLLLLLGGWYLLLRAAQEPGRWDLACFAGLALGELALTKIEFLFLPVLLCLWFLLRAWAGRPAPNGRVFLVACGAPTVHGILHLVFIARPYLHTFRTSLERQRLPVDLRALGALALALGVVGAVAMLLFRPRWIRTLARLEAGGDAVRRAVALFWIFLVVVFGPVRMALSPARVQVGGEWFPNYHRLSFLRLSWYLSAPGLVLGFAGVWWWIRRRLDSISFPFLLAFFFQFASYAYRTLADPYHFWMMRRYIPLVFPVCLVGVAVAIWRVRMAPLSRSVRRGGALLLVGLLLFLLVRADAPFASRREMAGTTKALSELAARVPDGAPLLIEHFGAALATPLRYLYGKAAYTLLPPAPFEGRNTEALPWETLWPVLREWPTTDTLYLLLEQVPSLYYAGFSLEEIGHFRLETWTTETSYDHLPSTQVQVRSQQGLFRLQRQPDAPTLFRLRLSTPVWTGVCTSLELPAIDRPVRLRVEAAGFRPQGLPPAHLTVFWQGRAIAQERLEPSWEPKELAFELRLSGGAGRLELCSDTWNPEAFGFGGTPRQVGIQVYALQLEEGR